MGNVWKAMQKHQAEEAARAAEAVETVEPPDPQAAGAGSDGPSTGPTRRRETAEVVPPSPDGYAEELLAYHDPGHPITEDYRKARISLLAQGGSDELCCLITSAAAGEGKTVTCGNLGFVLAEREDRHTILLDGDLRKASLGRLFQVKGKPGLAELIRGECSLEEAVVPLHCAHDNLFLLPASPTQAQEVGKLLARPTLESLVDALRKKFDYVLVDTPPMTMPDAEMIGRSTRDVVLVVRMSKTRREAVQDAKRRLDAAQLNVRGLILTHRKVHKSSYYYHYRYRYRYQHTES